MPQFRAVIYYDTKWDGTRYCGGAPGGEVFDKNVTFEQFIETVYVKKHIDKSRFEVRLHYVVKDSEGVNIRMPIVDDGDIRYAAAENLVFIYADRVERAPVLLPSNARPFVGVEFGSANNAGVRERPMTNYVELMSSVREPLIRDENAILRDDPDFDDSDFRELKRTGFFDGIGYSMDADNDNDDDDDRVEDENRNDDNDNNVDDRVLDDHWKDNDDNDDESD